MPCVPAIAAKSLTRTDLRLAVLAQWVRAGLALTRAAATGRGLVGGAVALWRLAQAVRLAMALARRLRETGGLTCARAPVPEPTFDLAFSYEDPAPNAAALRHALEAIAAAITNVIGPAPRERAFDGERAPSGSRRRRAGLKARPGRRPARRRRTPPGGLRPLRPPGPTRPGRRPARPARALTPSAPPIAPLAVGRRPLARA